MRILALGLVFLVITFVNCAAADVDSYEVVLGGTDESILISRTVERDSIPFTVAFDVTAESLADGYAFVWDIDKCVDSDGDGNPQNDIDYEGSALRIQYTENYNPSATLRILAQDGSLQASWENMIRNDFEIGIDIRLNGHELVALAGIEVGDADEISWTQVHMQRTDLEYMTEYDAGIVSSSNLAAIADHRYPGKYVYELQISNTERVERLRVVAWVVAKQQKEKPVGFMMFDLWNECYSEDTDEMIECSDPFSDSEAVAKLEWLRQEGFDHIDIMNQFAMETTNPYPEIVEKGRISYIADRDLEMLFEQVEIGQLSWQTYHFANPNKVDTAYWHDFSERDLDYFQEFFRQYHPLVIEKATHAQGINLESFMFGFQHPYLWGLCSLQSRQPVSAGWIADQWTSIIGGVRSVFSGEIGLGIPSICALTIDMASQVDFLYENLGGFRGYFLPPTESIHVLKQRYSQYLAAKVIPTSERFGLPLKYTFWSYTYTGSSTTAWTPYMESDIYSTWEPILLWEGKDLWAERSSAILAGDMTPGYEPNFAEQVRMLEALMPLLANEDSIEAIYSEYEYWKMMSFEPFVPANAIDYGSLFWGSLQGKPAYDAYKLWASMLSPNDRLTYRRRTEPPDSVLQDAVQVADLDWTLLPPSIVYLETDLPHFGYAPLGGQFQDTEAVDERFEDQGWQVESVSAAAVSEGLALRIRFAADDQASRDSFVQYVIGFGGSTRIHILPGQATLLFYGAGGNTGEVWSPDSQFAEVTSQELRVLIPHEILQELFIPVDRLVHRSVDLHIKHTGGDAHSFVNYRKAGTVLNFRE